MFNTSNQERFYMNKLRLIYFILFLLLPLFPKFPSDSDLDRILMGAAKYCQSLKEASFHYICKEEINERYERLRVKRKVNRFTKQNRKVVKNNYLYDYQMIKTNQKIIEKRKLIKGKDNSKNHIPDLNIQSFLNQRPVLGPIGLLLEERQRFYNYQFVKYTKLDGKRVAVIKSTPKENVITDYIYGKIWIDLDDYSVIKIITDPESIACYQWIKRLAEFLKCEPLVTHVTLYKKIHEGIRYPSKVSIAEIYRGGLLSQHFRAKGWIRSKIQYSYSDYKFFNISLKVDY